MNAGASASALQVLPAGRRSCPARTAIRHRSPIPATGEIGNGRNRGRGNAERNQMVEFTDRSTEGALSREGADA